MHPGTLRLWANEGKVAVVWVGRERRFSIEALDALTGSEASADRREALYVRVSGISGQESSLAAQEAELRASAPGMVVAVFRDRASGLRESRPGLDRLLKRAAAGGMEELLDDFMSLVAAFAGRMYGLRSCEARRLLAEADGRIGDPASSTGIGSGGLGCFTAPGVWPWLG